MTFVGNRLILFEEVESQYLIFWGKKMPDRSMRWSDQDLEKFHAEFRRHVETEGPMHRQQLELYEAVFRLEDKELGRPPGLLQLTSQINAQMRDMRILQDRQKTFIGGVMFAITSAACFFTDTAQNIISLIKKLV